MKRRSIRPPALAAIACACIAATPAAAEVAAEPWGDRVNVLVMGIIEDPDPICDYWTPFRAINPDWLLNPNGEQRGDGRPDLSFDPNDGTPYVVWSSSPHSDGDVAYSKWDGARWSAPAYLTNDSTPQLDPRVSFAPGTDGESKVHVVWWESGMTPEVWWTNKPEGGVSWSQPERVTFVVEPGRRPSVVEFDGTVYVAYERVAGAGTEIVIATRLMGGFFNKLVIATTQDSNQAHDPVLHVHGDVMWLDWRHSPDTFAHSEFAIGQWGAPVLRSWTNFSWIGLEEVRALTRGEVLAP